MPAILEGAAVQALAFGREACCHVTSLMNDFAG